MIGNTSNRDIIKFIRSSSQDFSQIHDRAREDFTDFQLIGEGSISKVLLAKSTRDQKKYAVKILNNKCSTYTRAPKQSWDMFMKEIHYLSRMGDHSNVMPILDFDYDLEAEQAYYVMPYYENLRSLRAEKIKVQSSRKEPLLNIKKLIGDCSSAIQHGFQKERITHDNLRLENVFYSENEDKFVVADWRGFPKKLQLTPRSGRKNVFCAPELSDPRFSLTGFQPIKADVYALAILAVEASGVNLPSVETKFDIARQIQESFIPAVIKLLQANETKPDDIETIKKMTLVNPDQRCSMLSLNPTVFEDPESLMHSVFEKFVERVSKRQRCYFNRWREKVDRQKFLEKGITFAKVLIACTNNVDHLLLQAFERWRDNTRAQSFLDRTMEMAHASPQNESGFEILAKCQARRLSYAFYKLRFHSTLLGGVLVPPDKRRFLVIMRCLRRFLRDHLQQWKQAVILLPRRGKSGPGSSEAASSVGENRNSLALSLKKMFAKRYIEGFSALKQARNRFKLMKICAGRMNEAIKAKLLIALTLWRGSSSLQTFQSMHKLLELENVIRNQSRKLLYTAFHKVKTHGIVDYQKSYIQAIWKWKLSHCEAKYYVRQDVFVKRARALAQLIATLEFKGRDMLKDGFDRIYAHKLRKPVDKSLQVKYLSMIIKNKMRKTLWDLKEGKARIERDQAERKQTLMQAAGRAGKILIKRVFCEQAKWFYRWRELLREERSLIAQQDKRTQGVERLFYFLASHIQNCKRIGFEGISYRSNLMQNRKKILLVNKLIRLRRISEQVAMYNSFTVWRKASRKVNPWFKKAPQRITTLSRINHQVAFWRLKGSVNLEGASLSEAKVKSVRALAAVFKKHFERSLSCAFWKIESYNEHLALEGSFISEEGRGRLLSSSRRSRGTRSPDMTLEDLRQLSHRYERGRQGILGSILSKYAAEELNAKRALHIWRKNAGLKLSGTLSTTAPSKDLNFFSRVGNIENLVKRLERLVMAAKQEAFDAIASNDCNISP